MNGVELSDETYFRLLSIRTGMRLFDRWSEQQAKAAGLTTAQHQLLLAIRGHPGPDGPTVGEVAEYLVLRHHSAVGLIDRAVAAGLVKRNPDPTNNSAVRIALTSAGIDKLDALSELHLEEIAHLAPTMRALWGAIEHASRTTPHPAARQHLTAAPAP